MSRSWRVRCHLGIEPLAIISPYRMPLTLTGRRLLDLYDAYRSYGKVEGRPCLWMPLNRIWERPTINVPLGGSETASMDDRCQKPLASTCHRPGNRLGGRPWTF